MEDLKELDCKEIRDIEGGGIPLIPIAAAAWLTYQTYNAIVEFRDDFKEGYNEYRNK